MQIKIRYAAIAGIIVLMISTMIPNLSFAGSWNGWIYQEPYPTGLDLGDVKFISPLKGWIVGKYGSIFYTADGGSTWETQESGTEDHLLKVFFINENSGWVVSMGGAIIHTVDGGKTWAVQYNVKALPTKIVFVNEQEGWLSCTTQAEGSIYHTKNGGKTWEKLNIDIHRAISCVFFINSQNGWIMAGEDVYRTTNGGKKWVLSKLPVGKMRRWRPPSFPGEKPSIEFEKGLGPQWFYGGITFASEKQGWAAVYHSIYHTADGGQTWALQFDTGNTNYTISKIDFRDSLNGCAAGWSVVCTDDGGKTWAERLGAGQHDNKKLGGVSLVGRSDGWAVGSAGWMYQTVDGGKIWKLALQSNGCGSSSFQVDKQTGWLYEPRIFNSLCRTDDGGRTWKKQSVGIQVWNAFFIDGVTGWVVGTVGKKKDGSEAGTFSDKLVDTWAVIKRTADSGVKWSTQYKNQLGREGFSGLQGIFFINANKGWVVGEKGIILHTEDGGKRWTRQKNSNEKDSYRRVFFINSQVGWITGYQPGERWKGIILNTTDGGKHWQVQYTQEDVVFGDIYSTDNDELWITGSSESGEVCILVHTINQGGTWSEKEFSDIGYNHITFLDEKRGAIFSENTGVVLTTTDGGKTWKRRRIPLKKTLWNFSEIFEK